MPGKRTPTEIVSSIKDQSLPNRITAADARAKGRYGHDKPAPENPIFLFVDHQIGLLASIDAGAHILLAHTELASSRTDPCHQCDA